MNTFKKALLFTTSFLFFVIQMKAQDAPNSLDIAGRKQGHWIKFDENKNKVYDGNFVDNIPVGKFIYFLETGTPWAITIFSQKGKVGLTQNFNKEGKLIAEGKYIDQKKDSLWKFYDAEGKIVSEERYLNGEKNGSCKIYYNNGKVSEDKMFVKGIPDGTCIKYFDNGTIKYKGQYIKDKAEGKTTFYYPSGKISIEGDYKNDFKNGAWNFYNEDGTLLKTVRYVNSKSQDKNDTGGMTKEEEEAAKKKYEESDIKDSKIENYVPK